LLLKSEGGFVNNPADPGGATNKGVTQRTYDAYRKAHGLPLRSVKLITDGETSDVYRMIYWNAAKADLLPIGVDYAVFDFTVNSGLKRAVIELQSAVNKSGVKKPLDTDGDLGDFTMHAVMDAEPALLLKLYVAERLSFQQSLPTWGTFGHGWKNRDDFVLANALKMLAK
jgi:lysozyme family protein